MLHLYVYENNIPLEELDIEFLAKKTPVCQTKPFNWGIKAVAS